MLPFGSASKSQAFIITMRWVILVIIPVLYLLGGIEPNSLDKGVLTFFVFITVVLTVCYIKKISFRPIQWIIVSITDLASVSVIVYSHGGIASDTYQLYYLIILQAGLIFGVKHALLNIVMSSIMYSLVINATTVSGEDIPRLLIRLIYCWLVGVTASYLAYLEKEHQRQSVTDKVTCIYNRRFLDHSLQHEIEKANDQKTNLSIVMIDIDNFKSINDMFGHTVGDMVLEKLARIIQMNIRDVDFVARYGGEEFMVTLPGTGMTKAYEIAERIRRIVEKSHFREPGEQNIVPVTISCGVASYPVQAESVEELIKKADGFLYEAKKAGRNRVHCIAG